MQAMGHTTITSMRTSGTILPTIQHTDTTSVPTVQLADIIRQPTTQPWVFSTAAKMLMHHINIPANTVYEYMSEDGMVKQDLVAQTVLRQVPVTTIAEITVLA
jgi:hypothetical protein